MLPAMINNVEVDAKDCWKSIDDIYDFLIANLKLFYAPNDSVFDGGSNAMPHMFEQMLIFHKAFFDESSSEHNRAVAEWRAVLSIMALQKVCNIKLELIRIDLSDENRNLFLKAAYRFRPEDTPVFFNTTWDFLYIVKVKNWAIAILSPITLVCPAKQFRKRINCILGENHPFIIKKVNEVERLSFDFKGEKKQEIPDLLKWLKTLQGNLVYSDLDSGEGFSRFEKVSEELDSFIKEYDINRADDDVSPLLHNVYHDMNNNVRNEFDFLNNCCGVMVNNPKLQFLVERYQEDIFEEEVLVFVYDDAPDTMEKEKNIERLKALYQNILKIENDKPIIEVYDRGGRRMAACVFLPFKSSFVRELIRNRITPNEFFGIFTAIYNPSNRNLELTLQIKEFPYCFNKTYPIKKWKYLYASNLEATYIWPTNQLQSKDWIIYYIYTEKKKDAKIEVSIPEAISRVEYSNKLVNGYNKEFQLCRTNVFPAYICYTYEGVSGYLPIWAKHVGTDKIGATAYIIIDMGHATTSITIVKDTTNDVQKAVSKEWQEIDFRIPRSYRIAGSEKNCKTVGTNFVSTNETEESSVSNCIKNMLHRFENYKKNAKDARGIEPFEDGQVLFDSSAYFNEMGQSIISYINFEYDLMDQKQREKVHIFIEQLLLFIMYQTAIRECSYMKIYFLHPYENNNVKPDEENAQSTDDESNIVKSDEENAQSRNGYKDKNGITKLGELKEVWRKKFDSARRKTGFNSVGSDDIIAVKNYEALTWYVYEQMYKREIAEEQKVAKDSINIGINIGWKDTNIVILSSENQTKNESKEDDANQSLKIYSDYITLEYAGRNISMLIDAANAGLDLQSYPQILSILLHGSSISEGESDISGMLQEFAELFDVNKRVKDVTHYQGIFDMIAMKIDEASHTVSRDIFNNVLQYRRFLMILTYNIILLFLEIGMLIQLGQYGEIKKVNLFLGGNGANFLKWISNDKKTRSISQQNASENMILQMNRNIVDYIKSAANLGEDVELHIELIEHVDQQLVQGCKAKLLDKETGMPEFEYHVLEDTMSATLCKTFVSIMNEVCTDVFRDLPILQHKAVENLVQPANDISALKLIENERKEIDKQVVDEINKIKTHI